MRWKYLTTCLRELALPSQSSHSSSSAMWEIDDMKERLRQIEISDAGQSKDVEHLTKLSEDRRRDIQKLFEKLDAK